MRLKTEMVSLEPLIMFSKECKKTKSTCSKLRDASFFLNFPYDREIERLRALSFRKINLDFYHENGREKISQLYCTEIKNRPTLFILEEK